MEIIGLWGSLIGGKKFLQFFLKSKMIDPMKKNRQNALGIYPEVRESLQKDVDTKLELTK